MKFSGISDEAGQPIEVQIKAHKELGWQYLELRNVDGENLTMMNDEKFEDVYRKVSESGLGVSCFSSCIANWATEITGDFNKDIDELKRAIPRMKKFNTKFIRVMSWPNDKNNPWEEEKWAEEVIRRMKYLSKIAEDGGVVLAHENCSGWAGLSPENSIRLLKEVNSPALVLLFDIGNVIPYTDIDTWDFYIKIKPYIKYVHIKDYKADKSGATFPGEGSSKVKEILIDLKNSGYNGFASIEPHIASIVHEGKVGDPELTYRSYIEYGRRLMQLIK